MQHLDEGTIHAWLDGALANEDLSRAEAHVRECRQCSAALAEARGLIAASSRILSSLDDEPVRAPGKAPTVLASSAAAARPAAVKRWFRPAYAAAAAVAIVALGTWSTLRNGDGPGLEADQGVATQAAVPASPAAERLDSAALSAPIVGASTESRLGGGVGLASGGEQAKSQSLAENAAREKDERPAQTGAAMRDETGPRPDEQKRAAPRPPLASVASATAQESRLAASDSTRVASRAPGVAPSRQAGRAAVAVESIVSREQSRLQGEILASRALTAAPAGASRAPAAVTARMIDSMVNVFAGCYSTTGNARANSEGAPPLLALLTRVHRRVGDSQTRVASATPAVPAVITWEWSLDGAFNILVNRVEGGSPLSTSFSASTPADLLLRRVACR